MTRRRGFTLIELLVVIGILIILVGIAAYGLTKVIDSSKATSTTTTLANLRSMITEFEVATKGLTRQPPRMYDSSNLSVSGVPWMPPDTYDVWRDANPVKSGLTPVYAPKGDLALKESGSDRYTNKGIWNTQLVTGLLLQAPGNKKLIEQFPPSQLMEELPAGMTGVNLTVRDTTGDAVQYSGTAANRNPFPPLVLDAWGNPVLFVPSGGLYNVFAGGVERKLLPTSLNPDSHDGPIKSPDGRPFWVSAGPDGFIGGFYDANGNGTFDPDIDKGYGNDNIYSFEN